MLFTKRIDNLADSVSSASSTLTDLAPEIRETLSEARLAFTAVTVLALTALLLATAAIILSETR